MLQSVIWTLVIKIHTLQHQSISNTSKSNFQLKTITVYHPPVLYIISQRQINPYNCIELLFPQSDVIHNTNSDWFLTLHNKPSTRYKYDFINKLPSVYSLHEDWRPRPQHSANSWFVIGPVNRHIIVQRTHNSKKSWKATELIILSK